MKKYPVITLCGSTRFKREFMQIQQELTLKGNVVLSVGVFGHSDNVSLSDKTKEMLDSIHRQKIDMSEGIFVINKGGYIGQSTRNEIAYAQKTGKSVSYLEPIKS